MKKFLVVPFVLFGFVLAGCGASATVGGNLFTPPTSETESTLTNSFISANTISEEALIHEVQVPKLQKQQHSFAVQNIVSDDYYSSGLLVVKNGYDRIGFYSVLHGDYLVAPKFENGWVNYTVTNTNYVGFVLNIKYEDEYQTYDGFGNALLGRRISSATTQIVNKKLYLTLNGTYFYEYSKDGVATIVSSIPQEIYVPEVDNYTGPKTNDLFVEGRMDLDTYGYANHSILVTQQGYYTTFVEGKPTVSFYVSSDYRFFGLIGSKMVFQRISQLSDDAVKFTFTRDNKKYSLETLLADFLTGEKVNKDTNIILQAITPLKKVSDSTVKYSYVTYYSINDFGAMVNPVGAIVDEDFRVHNDTSGMAIDSFIKLSNGNFFNTVTKILYDAEMNIITSLAAMNATYLSNMKVFRGTLLGSYGLVNESGEVVAEFRYNNIYVDDYPGNNNVIVTKGIDAYRLNLNGGATRYVGSNISRLSENLFLSDKGTYFSSDENLIEGGPTVVTQSGSKTYLANANKAFLIRSAASGTWVFNSIKYEKLSIPNIPASTKGVEVSTAFENGSTSKKSVEVKIGVNAIHTYKQNAASYARFVAKSSGYYSFYCPVNLTLSKVYLETSATERALPLNTVSLSGTHIHQSRQYTEKSTIYLTSGNTYIVKLNHALTTQQLYSLIVEKENGTDSKYPLVVQEVGATIGFVPSIFESLSDVKTLYAAVDSDELATYKAEAKTEGDALTATVNGTDATDGYVIENGDRRVFALKFKEALSGKTTFWFEKTAYEGVSGLDKNVPYPLTYMATASAPANSALPAATEEASYAYYRFRSVYGGAYSLKMTFSASVGIALFKVSALGIESSLYSSSSVKNFNYSYNSNSIVEPAGYLLVRIGLGNAEVTVSSYTLSSEAGLSYENPSSSFPSYSNSFPRFVKMGGTGSGSHYFLTFNSSINMSYLAGGKLNGMDSEGEVLFSSETSPIYLRAEPYSGYVNLTSQVVYASDDKVTLGEKVEFSDLDTGNVLSGVYTNQTNTIQALRLEMEAVNQFRYSYNVGQKYISASSYTYATGKKTFGNILLNPGETFRFFVGTSANDNSGWYRVSLEDYSIDLHADQENNSPWYRNASSFLSGSAHLAAGSRSEMSVAFSASGILSYRYYSDGLQYFNYLVIKINGTILLDCSETSPWSSYTYGELHVDKDDILTIEYIKKENYGANSDQACFSISSFVADEVVS